MSEAKVQLLGVLREATSQDYNRTKQAEELLKEWENSPSFFATLQVHSKKSNRVLLELNKLICFIGYFL